MGLIIKRTAVRIFPPETMKNKNDRELLDDVDALMKSLQIPNLSWNISMDIKGGVMCILTNITRDEIDLFMDKFDDLGYLLVLL